MWLLEYRHFELGSIFYELRGFWTIDILNDVDFELQLRKIVDFGLFGKHLWVLDYFLCVDVGLY